MNSIFRELMLTTSLILAVSTLANIRQSVSTVKGAVVVSDDVDYVVTSSTPFATDATINLANTGHAVLILDSIRPSAATRLLSHIMIGGEKAVNGANCQVKLYNRGTIILPYPASCKPLTVYSEPDFQGESASDFGLEDTGGFMNTLTEAKLNNRIQSFRLKRGYMVTFATRAGGRGYSRCFIAADRDLEVPRLPGVLNKTISSYRIFKWYDTGKQQLAAAAGDDAACTALHVTSTYGWGPGTNMSPDVECVPHHIHEGWPSPAELGKTTYSPHMKTNNEPLNKSDDTPNTIDEILANWETLMATGMRLCTPSSWDGSDYVSNASGFLASFLDSIDARGWRCDIIDLHCYWAEGTFNSMKNWVNKFHRPIWISEWVWGASWNNNGAFANGVTEAQNAAALKRICTNLNAWDYVERYYYWNGERDPSKLIRNGQLTEAGKYYASINSGLGYNGKYDYVPKVPRQYAPSQFSVATAGGKTTVSWRDQNGELNQLMEVQRKLKGGQWMTIVITEQKELAANYTYTDDDMGDGTQYRIHLIDANGVHRYTNNAIEAGDLVQTPDGRQLYAGGNLLVNGDFSLGMSHWTSGTGEPLCPPYFQAVPVGGIDGGSYLQAYQSAGTDNAGSLRTAVAVKPSATYFFRMATRGGNTYEKLSLTADGTTENEVVGTIQQSADWEYQSFTFGSGDYNQLLMAFRWLGTAQMGQMELRQLFETYDEAIADGISQDQLRAEAVAAWQAGQPAPGTSYWQQQVGQTLSAIGINPDEELAYEPASVQPQSPDFKSTTGWQLKAGSYKGGDQRQNTVRGQTCWNAWWSGLSANTGMQNTMEIRQEVKGLSEGVYTLQCKATTQHYCLSDQHAYLVIDGDTVRSQPLQADYFDLPTVADIWQTLTTLPVYVPEGGTITIGFKSSKQGATDNAWHAYGKFSDSDKREGWWCATDFELLCHPVHKVSVTVNDWHTICLPHQFSIPQGVRLYEVAGLLPGRSCIAVREVTTPEAGTPYLYTTMQPDLLFNETGTASKQAKTVNGLRGYYVVTAKAGVGSYVLEDNRWRPVTDVRPAIPNYTANIRKLDAVPLLDEWDGTTIPIVGLTDGVIPAAAASDRQQATFYQLDGTQASHPRQVYIKVKGEQVRKQFGK